MKKVIVIGCPGSGKSTFSKKLHNKINLPLYHLDMIFWNNDKTSIDKDIFIQKQKEVLKKENWIIDGNYISTLELRLNDCDTIIFLDYETSICLQGARDRIGLPRDDIPWIETQEDKEFIEYIKSFNNNIRPRILTLLENYQNKTLYIFKNRVEAEKFLNNFN